MTAGVRTNIVGVLLCALIAVSTPLDGQRSTETDKRDTSGGDSGDGGELSLRQTMISADKIVKSLATDEKIARAVQTSTSADKRISARENSFEDDAEDEEEEDEEEEDLDEGKEGKERREDKPNKGPKIWDQWSKWSACSVTCGIGKITRWRHCVSGGCAPGEKEAQIKTCTLPAC
ncbi:hypothetical protein Trydic_g14400 [Trypoxylus dichotomus]